MSNFSVPGQSVSDSSVFNTSFVVSCSPPKKSSDPLDTSNLSPGVIYANSSKTLKFVSNPIQTDVTQSEQCDINQLLQSNPDVSGLSLMLDNSDVADRSSYLSIEDFLPPSQYHDILDIAEFTRNAERAFFELPASIRKQFNNDPLQLCQSVESNNPDTLSLLNQYIYGTSDPQSAGTASRQGASSTNDSSKSINTVVETPPVEPSTGESSKST